jgi:GNAT superfamily N-acetyltransferase
MSETNFDLSGVTIANLPATAVTDETYNRLYDVEHDAMSNALPTYTSDEMFSYLRDRSDYAATRKEPNLLVEQGRVNPDQSYSRPEVTIAYNGDQPIGYAYCANNVSHKTEKERLIKQATIVRNYRTLRMIAVHPDYQGRGVAHLLAYKAYMRLIPGQPASAYTWPELLPSNVGLLESWGLDPTNLENPKLVQPFGPTREATPQVRFEAKRASTIGNNIAEVLIANFSHVTSPLELIVQHQAA